MKDPIGGHHYPEPGLMIQGKSFVEVVEKLLNFRRNNAKPVGNPDQDVLSYYEKNWPYLVEHTYESQGAEPEDDYVNWKRWIQNTWKHPPSKILTPKEAGERCAVCEKCPYNQPKPKQWKDELDYSETFKRSYLLRQAIAPQGEVFYCKMHKCDLPVLTLLDKPSNFVRTNASSLQPEFCWVK